MKYITKALLLSLSIWLLVQCNGGGSGNSNAPLLPHHTFYGQKGPFLAGSSVDVSRFNTGATSTEHSQSLQLENSLGELNFNERAGLIEVTMEGYYLDELLGTISKGPLRLSGVYHLDSEGRVFSVNILNHIVKHRIIHLIQQGQDFSRAEKQANAEFIKSMPMVAINREMAPFSSMFLYDDLGGDPHGNAYLSLMTTLFSQLALAHSIRNVSSVESELLYLLDTISEDFQEDGELERSSLTIDALAAEIKYINPDRVADHLVLRGEQAWGLTLQAANMNMVLDSDGDGSVNIVDEDDDDDGTADETDQTPYFNPYLNHQIELILDSSDPLPEIANISTAKAVVPFMFAADGYVEFSLGGVIISSSHEPPFEIKWSPYFWAPMSDTPQPLNIYASYQTLDGRIYRSDERTVSIPWRARGAVNIFPRDGDTIAIGNLSWYAPPGFLESHLRLWPKNRRSERIFYADIPENRFSLKNLPKGDYEWQLRLRREGRDVFGPLTPVYQFNWQGTADSETNTDLRPVIGGAYNISFKQPIVLSAAKSYSLASDDLLDIDEYHWDFGDGTSAVTTTPEVIHTYNGDVMIEFVSYPGGTINRLVQTQFPLTLSLSGAQGKSYTVTTTVERPRVGFTDFCINHVDIKQLTPMGGTQVEIETGTSVSNNGVPGSYVLKFYLSGDRIFDNADLLVHEEAAAPLDRGVVTEVGSRFTVSGDVNGKYVIGIVETIGNSSVYDDYQGKNLGISKRLQLP